MLDPVFDWLREIGVPARWAVAAAAVVALSGGWLRFGLPRLPMSQRTKWTTGAIGCILLAGAILGATWWSGWRLPGPTPDGKVGLWVAKFNGDTSNEALRLIRAVEDLIAEDQALGATVEVRDLKRTIPIADADAQFATAKELGRRVNASVVLFGDVANRVFFPRISIVQRGEQFRQTELRMQVGVAELDRAIKAPPVYQQTILTLGRLLVGFAHYERGAYPKALTQFRRAVQEFQEAEELAAGSLGLPELHLMIGNSSRFLSLRSSDPQPLLSDAIDAYTEALRFYTPEAAPLNYAQTRHNLGVAYRRLAVHGDLEQNVGLAITAYGEALRFYTLEAAPLNYAGLQTDLGVAYTHLALHRDPEQNVGLAITAYGAALRFRTAEEAPLHYATVQRNLGSAYLNLAGHRDPEENLGLAIDAYTEALRLPTAEAEPLNYALTHNNLGGAYQNLAAHRDPEQNFGLAITAYGEALRFRTADGAPLYYATTQVHLGDAYRNLAAHRDSPENLGLAVLAYARSLVVRNRAGVTHARQPAEALSELRDQWGADWLDQLLRAHAVALAEIGAAPADVTAAIERWTD